MGQVAKSRFRALKFDQFEALAKHLEETAKAREESADEFVKDVANPQGAGEFTGRAGDAARGKSETIAGAMGKKSGIEEQAGSVVRRAGSSLQSHRDAVANVLDDIEQHRPFVVTYLGEHFDLGHASVTEDWRVRPPAIGIALSNVPGLQDAINEIVTADQQDLDAKLKEFDDEDAAQSRAIEQATDFAEVVKSDDPLVGVTPDQAHQAVEHVLDGTATEEEKAIVRKGTELRGDELAALDAHPKGTVDVGPERWATIYQIERALDGKSTAEIAAAVSKLDPDTKKAVQRALELGSDPNVGSGAPPARPDAPLKDAYPQKGGKDTLPSGIRAALDRGDRATMDAKVEGHQSTSIFDPDTRTYRGSVVEKGVGELQDLADIMRGTPQEYMKGSDLDKGTMSAFAQYLHAENNPKFPANLELGAATYTGVTTDGRGSNPLGDIASVFGQDQVVVHDMATAGSGQGDQFIKDVVEHHWQDGGKAVGTMFGWEAGEAKYEPTGDPVKDAIAQANAQRAGETMRAVDNFMSSHRDELLSIAPDPAPGASPHWGEDPQQVGKVNPELMKAIALANAPYMADIAGEDPKSTHTLGFGPTFDDGHATKSQNLFGVMDTGEDSRRIFNAQAYATAAALEQEYGRSVVEGDPQGKLLTEAGRLHGLPDTGLNISLGNQDGKDDAKNAEAYKMKSDIYDWAKTNGGKIIKDLPFLGQAKDVADFVMDAFNVGKTDLIGEAPKPGQHDPHHPDNESENRPPAAVAYNVLRGVQEAGGGHIPDRGLMEELRSNGLLNTDGSLKSYAEIVQMQGDGTFNTSHADSMDQAIRKWCVPVSPDRLVF